MKNSGTAYFLMLACFVGLAGLNRFYTGRVGSGIIWFVTFGLLGFGILWDLFATPRHVREANILSGLGGQQQQQAIIVNVAAPTAVETKA